ncbi:carboxymuconolactone decarboxylase family protein [Oleiagrimonas sp. MCCC 1A03011]|uniref:carboxymuconolactone decarboxylase family protein n=1 Tax=Oleiagrimonas sp. MCCC 1A03011 TaxID=1926883 RepID=UPI000DC545A4|nr:carboxymuconolactone decarboxylase family protein [Oleiagrimonas sp. MCCC 1A03011]RAP57325.1 carboxymuconolactone decarboxylase [Oleiagrimonas sp. MCCC 1A03011]
MPRFAIRDHLDALAPLLTLGRNIRTGTLEAPLTELVLARASQINGCAFCLDMHTQDARNAGETEQRLHLLPAWRDTDLYSPRERAALTWCEALTQLGHDAVPDALYETVRAHFDESELIDLTLLITLINSWNRVNIAAATRGGDYRPGMFA